VYYDTSTNVTLNALTLSGGTANGVVYLNASKVATSGTALTFDGTNLGVGSDVGVSPTNGLTRSWGDAKRFAFMTFDASYYMEVNADAANRAINYTVNSGDGTAKHIWNLGASGTPSEQMRLNSSGLEVKQSQLIGYSSFAGIGTNGLAVAGNVGIGTNTPTAKLSAVGTPTVGALVASIPNDPNDSSVATITVGANTNGGIWGGGGFGLRIIDKTSNSGSNQIGYGLYVAAPFDGTNATGNTYALTKYGIYVDDIYSFYGINSPTTNANWGIYIKGGANNYIAGNLGIGTNAPSSALYVKRTSGNAGIYADYNGTNIGRLEAASNGNLYVGTTTGTGALILGTTANAAALELNNSGNLGLGVAPPSGSSTPGIFMSGVTNIFGSTSNGITFAANTYRDAGVFKYVSSSTASRYSQEAGAHSWLTAPSGTANDPISFTQAMTLDASGNLLVGTTTSSNRTITVGAANASIALADANGGIYFGATGTPVGSGGFGVNAAIARAGGTNFHISGSVAGDLCIAPEGTKAILFGTSASASSVTERARITSGGDVGIGTNAPTQKLTVNGNIETQNAGYVRSVGTGSDSAGVGPNIGVNSTSLVYYIQQLNASNGLDFWYYNAGWNKRLTLDSSGNLGIGTPTPNAKLAVSNAGAAGLEISPTSGFLGGAYIQGYNRSTLAFIPVEVICSSFAVVLGTTQAMTLDASGNLIVGATGTAQGRVHAHATTNAQFVATDATLGTTYGGVFRGYGVVGQGGNAELGVLDNGSYTKAIKILDNATGIQFFTGVTNAGSTERARITSTGEFQWKPDGSTQAMTLDASGRLLVGTTAQGTYGGNTAEFRGANIATLGTNVTGNLSLFTTDSQAADKGAVIGLGGIYADTTPYAFGAIAARKSNSTSGNAEGYLQFYTTDSSNTIRERARITSDGDLLVGDTTNPDARRLRVYGIAEFDGNLVSLTVYKSSGTKIGSSGQGDYVVSGGPTDGFGIQSQTALVFGSGGTTERARITTGGLFQVSSGGSVQVGGTAARATTAGTNRVDIFDGTAPVGTLANGVSFYSAAGEANVMDAAGNATLLSPHDSETNEWIFRSKHTPSGKVLRIDVERLLRFVNTHFGLDAVKEFVEE
jgi:hypothetical protein